MRPAAPKLPSLPLSHPPDSHFGAPRCAQTAFPETPGSASVRPAAPKWLFLSLRTHFGAPRCAETAFSAVRRDSRFLCFFWSPRRSRRCAPLRPNCFSCHPEAHFDAPRCAHPALRATQKSLSMCPAAFTHLFLPPRSPLRYAPLRPNCFPSWAPVTPPAAVRRDSRWFLIFGPPRFPPRCAPLRPNGLPGHPEAHFGAPRCARTVFPATPESASVRPAAPKLPSLTPRHPLRCAPLRPNCCLCHRIIHITLSTSYNLYPMVISYDPYHLIHII